MEVEYVPGTLVGTCMSMCPPDEIELRKKDPMINFFEKGKNGKFDPSLAVKSYHRSEAGAQFRAEDLRPIPVLQKTMDFLISHVLTTKGTNELTAHLYARDRFRSIRQDITCQSLHGLEVIEILEIECLFFIDSGIKFVYSSIEDFDPAQNMEQITQILLSLDDEYDRFFSISGKHAPREAIFRAIHAAVAITERYFMRTIIKQKNSIIMSQPMQQILKIRQAFDERNLKKFITLLEDCPIQLASIVILQSRGFWESLGTNLRIAFRTNSFKRELLENVLYASKDNVNAFYNAFKITQYNKDLKFDIKTLPDVSALPKCIVPGNLFEEMKKHSFAELMEIECDEVEENAYQDIKKEPRPIEIIEHEPTPPPEPVKQEEEEEKKEEEEEKHEEVKEEIKEEPKQIEEVIQPKEEEVEEEHKEEEEEKVEEEQHVQEVEKAEVQVEVNEKVDVLEEFKIDIESLIPQSFSEDLFATVDVLLDDSPASEFFKTGFEDNDTLFAGKFECGSSSFYLTIQKLTEDIKNYSFINVLNCTKRNINGTLNFRIRNGFSPSIALHEALFKLIKKSTSPIVTLDLSSLLKSVIEAMFDSIRSSAWSYATGNAVIKVINHVIEIFAEKIMSQSLMFFVVPPVHELLPIEAINEYKEKLLSLHLDNLDEGTSLTRIPGKTWPEAIKEGLSVNIDEFLVPVSVNFDRELFISEIIIDESLTYPSQILE